MTLREETIKVLREIAAPSSAETRDELANTINRDRHLASGLLSRLEAGSGEETWDGSYWHLCNPDQPPLGRPHVATPAPGENSGRAEADAIVDRFADWLFDTTASVVGPYAGWGGLRRAITEALAEARRSGLEEAAKVVNEEAALATTFVETATYGRAATIIRAIPEKQS